MNRKWMVAAGVAAILALVVGSLVGRSIIPSSADPKATPPARQPVAFVDRQDGIGLTYPGDWTRVHSPDPGVRLVAAKASSTAADAPTISLRLRVSKAPLALKTVTKQTLADVRKLTDQLLGADQRTAQLSEPEPISVGGLLGYRYRYTYAAKDGKTGAHVHYFLFKRGKLIQLVFQALPATTLAGAEPSFDRIAGTFTSTGP